MRLTFSSIAIVLVFALVWWQKREISHGPGVTAPNPPSQEETASAGGFEYKDFRIVPRAHFEVEARVLGKERYWFGREARLSPYDLAVGWGPMSDEAVLDEFNIWQSKRFYWWMSSSLPIPADDVTLQSANIHIIPSDDAVRRAVKRLRTGHVVQLSGHLVDVAAGSGWRWRTSMSREDTGNGACEILWVESISIVER